MSEGTAAATRLTIMLSMDARSQADPRSWPPSPGAFGADLSPPGRGGTERAAGSDHLSPVGRGRERSERVRGAPAPSASGARATAAPLTPSPARDSRAAGGTS